jgi:alkanesulfonate monooxygenase SsuD/methylene tetrahydromethanopterin reductase-like flavin-dependent oxidoreductase (luciferase family)
MHRFVEFAKSADDAGFQSVWNYEFYRNPFVIHAGTAAATERIGLATGIAAAFARSPFEAANAVADVDELSGGRAILGIGPGAPDFLHSFHSTEGDRPLGRMSEYLDVLRLSWDYLNGDGAPTPAYEGKHYRLEPPPFNPWGGRELVRERVPVYLAAMRPKMLELAGEKADGALGFVQTPEFAQECVRPALERGAQRAGREVGGVLHAALVICSVSDDREEALRRARIQVGMYIAYPIADVVVAFHGFEKDQAAIREAMMSGGVAAVENATSDRLVEQFAICGTPPEAREQAKRFADGFDQVVLHTPYVPPLAAEDTTDAFYNIVRAFGD